MRNRQKRYQLLRGKEKEGGSLRPFDHAGPPRYEFGPSAQKIQGLVLHRGKVRRRLFRQVERLEGGRV